MSNYLVSRHEGAIAWLENRGFDDPILVTHATVQWLDTLTESDMVFGTLPLWIAEYVCHQNARFFSLDMDIPVEARGKELTSEMMEEFGAKLTEYRIYECGRRTRLADMANELRYIAKVLAQSGETLRSITSLCHKAWKEVNYKW